GFIGSNLALKLQSQFPGARITIIDDFRSGDFRNLQGFRGALLSADVSRLDLDAALKGTGSPKGGACPPLFSAIFHLASITDTTVTDAALMCRDNIEGFRRVLEFARPSNTPLIYASSAATYGIRSGVMKVTDPPAPANAYAFSKMVLDNLAKYELEHNPDWKIVGVRYFNVFGPGEGHKGAAASMIYQLAARMKAGKLPRVFKFGEQKRDFIYVKDAVDATIGAMGAKQSGIYNVGSGVATSFNEVINLLNLELGTSLEPDYFDCPYDFYQTHTQADLSHTKKMFGWSPRYAPAAAIREYIRRLFP
ncbi:MAG: NAD-dependent epimerase/dehydratase family protein, partial [bacterium]